MPRRSARQGLTGSLDAKVNNMACSYGCEGIVNDRSLTPSPAGWEVENPASLREREFYCKEQVVQKKKNKKMKWGF